MSTKTLKSNMENSTKKGPEGLFTEGENTESEVEEEEPLLNRYSDTYIRHQEEIDKTHQILSGGRSFTSFSNPKTQKWIN